MHDTFIGPIGWMPRTPGAQTRGGRAARCRVARFGHGGWANHRSPRGSPSRRPPAQSQPTSAPRTKTAAGCLPQAHQAPADVWAVDSRSAGVAAAGPAVSGSRPWGRTALAPQRFVLVAHPWQIEVSRGPWKVARAGHRAWWARWARWAACASAATSEDGPPWPGLDSLSPEAAATHFVRYIESWRFRLWEECRMYCIPVAPLQIISGQGALRKAMPMVCM